MDYYLETNAVRQLASKLDHQILETTCFTSILSLIEIASGIKDEPSYKIRSTIIQKVLESKLAICIALPETLHLNAFGFPLNDKDISSGIRRVLDILVTADSYKSFQSALQKTTASEYFEFIQTYDKHAEIEFGRYFDLNINEARSSPGFNELKKAFENRWNSNDPSVATELYDTLLDYYTTALYNRQNEFGDFKRSFDDIKESYDHSLDSFFILSFLYSDRHISSGNQVGKNDYFDLSHLMYLPDTTSKIIPTINSITN